MGRKLNPQLKLEKELSKQIYEAIQGKVVEEVMKLSRTTSTDNYWRSTMEGHSFKVERTLLEHYYDLFHEVKEKLGFTDPIDFYITGDSIVNAFSLAAEDEGKPHVINVNSALLELMSDDELRFVIGHEVGHLINRDTAMMRLIDFVFPTQANIPIALSLKIRLWEQLAELVADRYGYLAAGNLDVCVTAFFKMASGLDLDKMEIRIDTLIEQNIKNLEYFLKDEGVSRSSHPVNPIRVQSLNLFATSKTQKELNAGMEQLLSILLKVGTSELDRQMGIFVATAGLIMASADGVITQEELDEILGSLSSFNIYPQHFLETISKGSVDEMFAASIAKVLEIDPSLREVMMGYIISLLIADSDFDPAEIELMYRIAENFFGYSRKECAGMFAKLIQIDFSPKLEKIC